MVTHILRSPDGDEGEAGAAGDAPASPKVVKRTPAIRTPAEADLQKKVSKLEDRVGTLEGTIDDVNKFLADALPQPRRSAAPTKQKSILEEIDEMLG